ncbi:hypothetical protein [Pantoea septica]|uniref:hypothetical protein n=1 Tax=Pantoea septica TaxID=472695 RepID=UPI0023F91815|nr:hypothetical protein [Pantoea septica]
MMQFTEEQRKALAVEIVERLVDYGSADDVAIKGYKAWVFKRLNAAAPAVPPGWKLVPVQPTPEMISAGKGGCVTSDMAREIYDDMLAAAPGKPQ